MASRTEVGDTNMFNVRTTRGKYEGVLVIDSLTDNYPLTALHPTVIFADPAGGAKDILMPADSVAIKGLMFTIVNTADAAEAIVLKTSADAALTPAVSISQNTSVTMVHGGGTGLTGWRRAEGL